jgi:hypothetical protein
VKKSFNIQELLHHTSKRQWNQALALLIIESFPKTPRTRSEESWFGGSHIYKTKQNKTNYLPS